MKNFIIATIIFIVVALLGIVLDAFLMDYAWEAMPNLIYYALGWLAAGTYILVKETTHRKDKGDK